MNLIKLSFIVLLFTVVSCGSNCKNLPDSYENLEEARSIILNTNFAYKDYYDVSESSFITSANYYSCDGMTGYLILGIKGRMYIFQNLPIRKWQVFKNSKSKGNYFNNAIKGRYSLKTKL